MFPASPKGIIKFGDCVTRIQLTTLVMKFRSDDNWPHISTSFSNEFFSAEPGGRTERSCLKYPPKACFVTDCVDTGGCVEDVFAGSVGSASPPDAEFACRARETSLIVSIDIELGL